MTVPTGRINDSCQEPRDCVMAVNDSSCLGNTCHCNQGYQPAKNLTQCSIRKSPLRMSNVCGGRMGVHVCVSESIHACRCVCVCVCVGVNMSMSLAAHYKIHSFIQYKHL